MSKSLFVEDIRKLGITSGDTVLIRAALSAVGTLPNGPNTLIDALLDVIGEEGTLVSLAFTGSSFFKKADPSKPFRLDAPSYAGAFPNLMLKHSESKRSMHPTCSYVAIGRNAEWITSNHDHESPAYEPIRKIMEINGKMALIGCVASSPGFTTSHLAEYDLGLLKRVIFPWLNTAYYQGENGALKLFKRHDLGMCSNSFQKFYSFYVMAGIMKTGFIGNAYSILVPAKEAYTIEKKILSKNPKFNICYDPLCFMCNVRRWDRIYRIPSYAVRLIIRKIKHVT